jgi:hypothetical protein
LLLDLCQWLPAVAAGSFVLSKNNIMQSQMENHLQQGIKNIITTKAINNNTWF